MRLTRRAILSAAAIAPVPLGRRAAAAEPWAGERGLGRPDARVTVIECFSLTCTHCAAFSRETMPQVKTTFVDTGKVRFVYQDFPLDQVALTAAMVARSLPAERYEPFITALFASQDRWAFARGVNSTEELWKMAALAGMNREAFTSAISNNDLKSFILGEQDAAEKKWGIDSTPTFVVNGQKNAGALGFDAFSKVVTAAGA
jgi:protein-disulfide isomerase